jgi:hypothetical protein
VATTVHGCSSYEVENFDDDNDAELMAHGPP